ncbi:MAG: hypothetical protein JO016_15880 [Actinobacteria bacterium]|nr:hypothetical protein [Actinomycetota bacterium]
MRGSRAGAMAAVVTAAALMSACSHAAPSRTPPPAVTMAFCGGGAQARPTVVEVICATNDIIARDLTWSGWGGPVATARGTAVVDLCATEDCHTGDYASAPIVLVASELAPCSQRQHGYLRLQYVFVGTSPFQGVPVSQNFSQFMAAPDRPGLPANQTIRLSC